MKKFLALLMALIMCLSICACGGNDDSADTDNKEPVTQKDDETEETKASEGTLGDYAIKFTGFSLSKDYEGKDVIIVSYDFTNNSDEAEAAIWAVNIKAFQDGVELETAFVLDNDDIDNSTKEIKSGVTLSCCSAFVLDNTSSSVEFEASELISFSDDVIAVTYDIAE